MKRLVLYNQKGDVVRVFPWEKPENLWAVFRKDIKKLVVTSSLMKLQKKKVPYETLAQIPGDQISGEPLKVGSFGHLKLSEIAEIPVRTSQKKLFYDSSVKRKTLFTGALFYVFIGLLLSRLEPGEISEEAKEEEKREIVKVVRKKRILPRSSSFQPVSINRSSNQKTSKKSALSWKRKGALAALGQLNKSNQRGGLDLGNVKVKSAGPGLGGSQGSGGVQSSIYAKGLVAAPLGAGHNVKGGGGYGTKGKGGGKAGYGSLSLVGSTGASLIPVPREASVQGGLDRQLVFDVVNRNKGQIRFCYEQGLQLNSSLSGRVAVFWVIDADGRVKSARIKKTSLNNKSVEDCILNRLRTWKFPIPENSKETPVSYPFLLKRTG